MLKKDAPWRAPPTAVKTLPQIHHSHVICLSQNPHRLLRLHHGVFEFCASVSLNLVNYECVSSIYFHRTWVFLYLNEKLKFRKGILKTFFVERGLGDWVTVVVICLSIVFVSSIVGLRSFFNLLGFESEFYITRIQLDMC